MRFALVGVLGFLLGAAALALGATDAWISSGAVYGALLAVGTWMWVGTGVYAWWRRPANRLGQQMIAVGVVWAFSVLAVVDQQVVYSLGLVVAGLYIAFVVQMLLSFPGGRLQPGDINWVVGTYVLLGAANVVLVLVDGDFGRESGSPPANVLAIGHMPDFGHVTYTVFEVTALAFCIRLVLALSERMRAATPAQRRDMAPVLTTGMVLFDALALSLLLDVVGASEGLILAPQLVATAAFCLLPLTFLLGLARTRWFRAGALGSLVERLNAAHRVPLRDALASALGDRSLEVVFWNARDERYIDEAGQPVLIDEDGLRVVSEVLRDGRRVGALVHDRALCDDPELIQAAVAAAALALDNERLEAELRARVEELERSRAKLIEVGIAERRRLERDLHDGAQQRLVALGLQVSMARARLEADPVGAGEILDGARVELRAAQEELRELARGIHPAILTDRGLGAAVESLADRATVPVAVASMPVDRLPGAVEAAAYFVVAESLTNVAKHAPAARAEVRVSRVNGHAVVVVSDDGPGGAQASGGSGLRGLADRLAAVDGRLSVVSPDGRGTSVRAEIPCASS